MTSHESTDVLACRQCSAPIPTRARYCWMCGVPVRPEEPVAARPASTEEPNAAPAEIVEPRAAYQFGISTVMLIITLSAVLLGVFQMQPGIGLALLFLLTPALVRTCVTAARREARGQPMSPTAKLGVFGSTVGIVIVVVAASIAAFFAVCAAFFSGF